MSAPDGPSAAHAGRAAVRPVDTSNVGDFVELLYRCFGYSFSWPWVYEENKVLEQVRVRRAFFFIAYDAGGVARGLLGLNRRYPTEQLASMAPFVVDPRVGRADSGRYLQLLLKAVEDHGWDLVLHEGLRAIAAQPVCEHRLTQRFVRVVKFVTTGVLLGVTMGGRDLLRTAPEDRVGEGGESLLRRSGDMRRTSETLVVRAIPRGFPEPEAVCLPHRFGGLLREIYSALRVPIAEIRAPTATGATVLETRREHDRSFVAIEVLELGADAPELLAERLAHYVGGYNELLHFVLPLGQGNLDSVVEVLVEKGCRFAGLLPCYRSCGVLLMQHLSVPAIVPSEDQLVDPLARRILREIGPED